VCVEQLNPLDCEHVYSFAVVCPYSLYGKTPENGIMGPLQQGGIAACGGARGGGWEAYVS